MGAFFVCVLSSTFSWAFCPPQTHWPLQRVFNVIDGDSVELADGQRVRLAGINAPELAKGGQPAQPYAQAARRRLKALIENSQGLVGMRVGTRAQDHYGRTLAHLYDLQGRPLESQLLQEGLAWQVAFVPATGLEGCLQNAERSARQQQLGVWQQPRLTPRQIKTSGFAIVQARLLRIERTRAGVWLEFEGPLVAKVALDLADDFDWPQLNAWLGREFELRGWLIDRRNRRSLGAGHKPWLINLSHPLMLSKPL